MKFNSVKNTYNLLYTINIKTYESITHIYFNNKNT